MFLRTVKLYLERLSKNILCKKIINFDNYFIYSAIIFGASYILVLYFITIFDQILFNIHILNCNSSWLLTLQVDKYIENQFPSLCFILTYIEKYV